MKRTLIFLAVLACNKPSTDNQASASATATVATKAPPKITIDGKDAPASHVMIQKVAAGNLQLFVGEGSSCEELKTHVFMGGKHFLLDLGPVANNVAPVTNVWHGPPETADPGSTVTLHGDVVTASKIDVDLAVASKDAKLDAKGTVSAEVCK